VSHDLTVISVLCLAVGSSVWTLIGIVRPAVVLHVRFGGRRVAVAHLAANVAVGLLGLVVAIGIGRIALDLPYSDPQWIDRLALAATTCAVTICLWDRTARFPLAAFYALGFVWLSMGHLSRNLSPSRLLVWIVMAEWAGFLLVSAAVGWLLPWIRPVAARLRIPDDGNRWSRRWFLPVQGLLAAVVVLLVVWVAIDFSFDGVGESVALFGIVGRAAICTTSLMLVGTAILMAWQSTGAWRTGWQYAAMAAGLLFTTSISWSRIGADAEAPWVSRSLYLAISAGMMTLMTRIGFAMALPRKTDWIPRGRRAAPVFAILSLLMFAFVLIRKAW
jgi:hypothetical protein